MSTATPSTWAVKLPAACRSFVAKHILGASLTDGILIVVGVILATLILPSIFFVFYTSAHSAIGITLGNLTFDNYLYIFNDPISLASLRTTIFFAAGTTICVLLLSAPLAWLTERTDAPLRSLAYIATFATFAIPGVIKTLGWIFVLGPRNGIVSVALRSLAGPDAPGFPLYTVGGLVLVESLNLLPMAFLFLTPAFRAMDPSLEETAEMSGASRVSVFFRVTLPLMLPSLLAVGLLSFVAGLEAFETPALIGPPAGIVVFSTDIRGAISEFNPPRYGLATAYAVLLMLLVAAFVYPYHKLTSGAQRFATVTGKAYRPSRVRLGVGRWPAGLVMLLLPGVFALPILMLGWASLLPIYEPPSAAALAKVRIDNYLNVFRLESIYSAASNSLVLGILASVGTMLLSLAAAWLVLRTRHRGRHVLDLLATLPLAVPAIVLSIATLRTYINSPLPIYGTSSIILLAYITHFTPYGMRYGLAGLVSLHKDLEEVATVSGAGALTIFRRIIMPLLAPTLIAGGIYIFLATMRQLSLVVFLTGPGHNVIAAQMFQMWLNTQLTQLAAFAIVVVAVLVGISGIFYSIASRFGVVVR